MTVYHMNFQIKYIPRTENLNCYHMHLLSADLLT
jgi:hypothetical protein